MKKIKLIICVCLFGCLISGNSFATDLVKECRETFSKNFPKTPVQNIVEAPVVGLCEIHSGVNVLYYDPKGFLVVGEIYNTTGSNLTTAVKDDLTKKVFENMPLDLAVKEGNGPVQVIVFTDPDCPYCKKLTKFFADDPALMEKMTLYTFLFPLDQLHPRAAEKSKWIFCQEDEVMALNSVMLDDFLTGDAPYKYPDDCKINDVESRLYNSRQTGKGIAVNGTPAVYVNGVKINGGPDKIKISVDAAFGKK